MSSSIAKEAETQKRQAIFDDIDEKTEQIEILLEEQKWSDAAAISKAVANQIAQLNQLFPISSKGEGRSKDTIWEQWPEFQQDLGQFQSHYQTLFQSIESQNYNGAIQAIDKATSSCRSCHSDYRSFW